MPLLLLPSVGTNDKGSPALVSTERRGPGRGSAAGLGSHPRDHHHAMGPAGAGGALLIGLLRPEVAP